MRGNLGEVEIYEAPDGVIRLDVRLERDTVWLTQAQMVELFGRDLSVISWHIGNAFKERELEREGNMQKMHIPNSDKPVELYSLDVIISVGYRVKSPRGTQFRIWATRTLKEHLVRGFTRNLLRVVLNARERVAALERVRKAAAGQALTSDQGRGLVEL